jgi:hypothetical protein
MTKTNYAYEKRQRELAKKQKKESKQAEKAARKGHPEESGEDQSQAQGVEPSAHAESGQREEPFPPVSASKA